MACRTRLSQAVFNALMILVPAFDDLGVLAPPRGLVFGVFAVDERFRGIELRWLEEALHCAEDMLVPPVPAVVTPVGLRNYSVIILDEFHRRSRTPWA
jgi:hypothetical protein